MGSSLEQHRLLLLALAAAAAAGGGWLALRLRIWRVRRRLRHGQRGQQRARAYLERRGFDVLAEEHAADGEVRVDGEAVPYTVRIDYLVRRGRRTYGVEVKTGDRAPDPLHRATRRQLLEYSQVLAVDGLLLLDMDRGRLMEVSFPGAPRRGASSGLLLAAAFVIGALTVALLRL